MEENMIKTLQKAGLTEGESKTYLALTSIGTSTVGPIIEKANVSASKVYMILDKLIAKGLVTTFVKDKTKYFSPSPPDHLLTSIEEQQKLLDQNKKEIKEILPSLKAKIESVSKYPMAEYATGYKGFEALHAQTLSEAKPNTSYLGIAGKGISFAAQQYWFKESRDMYERGISQFLLYEYDVWHKKDPKIHRRKERKLYYPRVLNKKFKDLPNITLLGDNTLITGVEGKDIFTLIIRHKKLTNEFRKLLLIIRDMAETPKDFPKKEFKLSQ